MYVYIYIYIYIYVYIYICICGETRTTQPSTDCSLHSARRVMVWQGMRGSDLRLET